MKSRETRRDESWHVFMSNMYASSLYPISVGLKFSLLQIETITTVNWDSHYCKLRFSIL